MLSSKRKQKYKQNENKKKRKITQRYEQSGFVFWNDEWKPFACGANDVDNHVMAGVQQNVFEWIEQNSVFAINKPLIFIQAIPVMLMQNMRIF